MQIAFGHRPLFGKTGHKLRDKRRVHLLGSAAPFSAHR